MRVAGLWRFPVKSMQGERVPAGEVTPAGLAGDRRYAAVDAVTGKVLTAKRVPALLQAAARTRADGSVEVAFGPDRVVAADDPDVHRALSDLVGVPCRLAATDDQPAGEFEMSFDVDDPEVDLFTWPCPPGTFLDLAAVHLLTTASLEAGRALLPDADWDVRRFRPTVLVDAGDAAGFVEDAWVGAVLHVGSAILRVDMPTVRCPLPTRAQPGLPADRRMAHTLRAHHDNNLGVYASVVEAGEVGVGDELSLADPA